MSKATDFFGWFCRAVASVFSLFGLLRCCASQSAGIVRLWVGASGMRTSAGGADVQEAAVRKSAVEVIEVVAHHPAILDK